MGILAEGTYLIKNFKTDLYVGVRGNSDKPSAALEQQELLPEGARESQQWRLTVRADKGAKDGDHFLTNVRSGLRMHVASHSAGASEKVEQFSEDDDLSLQSASWRISEEPSVTDAQRTGLYAIANSLSGLWLNVRNYELTPGTPLEQWVKPEHGGRGPEGRDFALWVFEPVGAQGTGGTSTVPPKETTESVRCGGKFDSYLGHTYKGTYEAESVRLPDGTSAIGHTIGDVFDDMAGAIPPLPGKEGMAKKGSDFGRVLGEAAADAMAEKYDVTARFFLDGNERRVEVTTLKRVPGAKPHTHVTGFGLNLGKQPAAVEFSAHTFRPYTEGEVDVLDVSNVDIDVTSEHEVVEADRSGRRVEHRIDFSVQAMDCPVGSHTPQRLHETRTKDGMKFEIDLRRV
ncbi:RICIN domain-containing protein [Streptomyces rectiverticillatus]|uniref:RICIN domain-containing protein n=1 Tax=Streptomyces rectiverticillatus TaxID=173860 RepID=UPI0015C382AC|nr:RICIN domain-containing protein [Streptomyces rectiverticillatus]QLE72422.1 RICIN domain-containing protein [Streptomyces rectiverticillatus]